MVSAISSTTTRPSAPLRQPAAGKLDLCVLALAGRVGAFVVSPEQQDHLRSVCVAKHPKEKLRLAEAKLEEACAELAPKWRSADAYPLLLKDAKHRPTESPPLMGREIVPDPVQNRLPALVVLIELDLVGVFLRHEAGA